jgi:hypothetical protein
MRSVCVLSTDPERTMSTTLTIYLRADPEPGAEAGRARLLADAAALRRTDAVDDLGTFVWGREIRVDGPLADTDYHRTVLGHVRDAESWAASRDAPTTAPFEHRRVDSAITGDRYEVVRLPSAALAVHEDGRLSAVYPCVVDGEAHTVADGLAALATRRRPDPGAGAAAVPAGDGDASRAAVD